MGARKQWYVAHCDKHGRPNEAKGLPNKRLRVPAPTSRNERKFGGCPLCAQERREAMEKGIDTGA